MSSPSSAATAQRLTFARLSSFFLGQIFPRLQLIDLLDEQRTKEAGAGSLVRVQPHDEVVVGRVVPVFGLLGNTVVLDGGYGGGVHCDYFFLITVLCTAFLFCDF